MPYIKDPLRRKNLEAFEQARDAGELNFQITSTLLYYLELHGKSYKTINDIVGALECAKQEFLRRVVAPYEDTKIATNGDVYP